MYERKLDVDNEQTEQVDENKKPGTYERKLTIAGLRNMQLSQLSENPLGIETIMSQPQEPHGLLPRASLRMASWQMQ